MARLFLLLLAAAWLPVGVATDVRTSQASRPYVGLLPAEAGSPTSSSANDEFLEDLSRRSFQFFIDHAAPDTGIVRDRARTTGEPVNDVGSIAAVGFGLTGLCIAADRGWIPRADAAARAGRTLAFFAERMEHERGWFYHFVNLRTGAREWKSELSSIDTALLLAGVLTARRCFDDEPDIVAHADAIYRRVDFRWMLAGDPLLLSHGWRPESGFLTSRWDRYCELMILYVLAIGSPTHPIAGESWHAWTRPVMTFDGHTYVSHADPLFVHQYSHAWIDFRNRREQKTGIDWFENSVTATRAHKAFCLSLSAEFPGYTEDVWGITASDSQKGYVAWGGPPRHDAIDGSVVPAAAAGSLMFAPDITVPALRAMHARFGGRIYGRYGFADAFHPTSGWVNPDVIGIDVGITLLSAENLRTGRVWEWFMENPEVVNGLERAGVTEELQRMPKIAMHAMNTGTNRTTGSRMRLPARSSPVLATPSPSRPTNPVAMRAVPDRMSQMGLRTSELVSRASVSALLPARLAHGAILRCTSSHRSAQPRSSCLGSAPVARVITASRRRKNRSASSGRLHQPVVMQ